MQKLIGGIVLVAALLTAGFVAGQRLVAPASQSVQSDAMTEELRGGAPAADAATSQRSGATAPSPNTASAPPSVEGASSGTLTSAGASAGPNVYSHGDLLALAGDDFADGRVPLGDYKYVTNGPKKGYVYLCNARQDNPGSMVNGPWISGNYWNFLQKISIQGSVSWPNASFTNTLSGSTRTLATNALPTNHTTGSFPVASSDPAAAYDKNPNTISAQSLTQSLPKEPTYLSTPNCMGGEAGIMLTGVPLFNAFDAGLRDALAHELQDSCDGHPQGMGEYHYHGMSSCWKDTSVSAVLGYAYDGFPITGPLVATGKYLTTDDLDECHGLTSEVVIDGVKKVTYHYVMTQDFPYSVSCFRGKSYWSGPGGMGGQPQSQGQPPQGGMPPPRPR